MVKYSFDLTVKESNQTYVYEVDLQQFQEDAPRQFFTPVERQKIRDYFQQQSRRRIDDLALEQIIKAWIQDIRVGERVTRLSLKDLHPLPDTELDNLWENGNQELPELLRPDLSGIEPILSVLPPLDFV